MLGFFFGTILNMCWIPLFIVLTLCLLVIGICQLFRCIFCLGCSCIGRGNSAAETANKNRAQQQLVVRKNAEKEYEARA